MMTRSDCAVGEGIVRDRLVRSQRKGLDNALNIVCGSLLAPFEMNHFQTATPPVIRSIASIASVGSLTPIAFTFSAICAGRDAPMIAEVTSCLRSTHASDI